MIKILTHKVKTMDQTLYLAKRRGRNIVRTEDDRVCRITYVTHFGVRIEVCL